VPTGKKSTVRFAGKGFQHFYRQGMLPSNPHIRQLIDGICANFPVEAVSFAIKTPCNFPPAGISQVS
tara:strand:+ start:453 stop:653 length:201 start_codon:yes stop_codon:yes gene_type:complete